MGLFLGRKRRRTPSFALSAVAVTAVIGSGATSNAAVTPDRLYNFGENDSVTSGPVTIGTRMSTNGFGDANDSAGNASGNNEVITLVPVNATNSPVYRDVAAGPLARPFATAGEIGIEFTSSAGLSALQAEPLGSPGQSVSSSSAPSIYAGGVGPFDYEGVTNRGYQFWVRPSRVNVNQVMVYDTDQHVVGISSNGRWFMQYRRTRPAVTSTFGAVNDLTVDTTVPQSLAQANQWYHVMMVRPYGAGRKFEDPNPTDGQFPGDTDVSLGPNGGARLYINGVAVAAETGGFDTSVNVTFSPNLTLLGDSRLYVGGFGPTPSTGAFQGIQQPFLGVMDDLEMFVTGRSFAGTGFGDFDLATDNDFILNSLAGIGAGDLNRDGVENATDVNAFVGGWLSRNLVNNISVGDLRSRAKGDVNLDGVVNLQDWSLINQSSPGTGMAIGQALGFIAVPEPTTLLLAALASLAAAPRARRG